MVKELKFNGRKQGAKLKPLRDTLFYYFSTKTVFNKQDLKKLVDFLRMWNLIIPNIGEVVFTEGVPSQDETVFALTFEYRSMPPITKEESEFADKEIIDGFILFFNQRIKDLNLDY